MTQIAQQVARISDRQQRQNIAGCAEILAGLRFERDLIRQFFREDIMRESVIYQDILQQGRRQEALSFIMRLLDRQLGEINPATIERVQALSIEQLEDLGIALLDFSQVADLMTWLEQQELSN